MAEKQTGNDKERCVFLCPLCDAPKPCIGHLTEHLKKFHRPLAELGPFSKRDDRLRLSSKQKENLTKIVPKNRYKSKEYIYSLIKGIVAPEPPMAANDTLYPPGKEDVKPPTSAPQLLNLQEYFRSHYENTLNMFRTLTGSDKERFVRHYEYLLLALKTTDVEIATGAESQQPTPAMTISHPIPGCPAPIPDPVIAGLDAYEVPPYGPSSSDQNFVPHNSAGEWQSHEWLDYEEQG